MQKRRKLEKVTRPLLLWKPLRFWQSQQSLRQDAQYRLPGLLQVQKRHRQEIRLNNTRLHYRPISLTAADSQQQSKDLPPYEKNQFYIRYRKTGTDHTLSVDQPKILGEPILSISALKAPLCRQRFLRICPMYSFATAQIKKKEEAQMEEISSRGNKVPFSMTALLVLAILSAAGSYRLKKTAQINRWEKELAAYSVVLEKENQLVKSKLSQDKK